MLPFRIRKDAKAWFSELRNKDNFKLDFDAFYFCFIAGISQNRKDPTILQNKTDELVAYFPEKYQSRGKLLVALFLNRELHNQGIKLDEKEAVHGAVAKLISTEAPNYLSEDGVREFNRYAYGGYDVLLDWFDDKPRRLETFLSLFGKKIKNVHPGLKSSSEW